MSVLPWVVSVSCLLWALIATAGIYRVASAADRAAADHATRVNAVAEKLLGASDFITAMYEAGVIDFAPDGKWLALQMATTRIDNKWRHTDMESRLWHHRSEWLKKQSAAKPVKKAGAR